MSAIELATQEDTIFGEVGSSNERADSILFRNVLSKMRPDCLAHRPKNIPCSTVYYLVKLFKLLHDHLRSLIFFDVAHIMDRTGHPSSVARPPTPEPSAFLLI